MLFIFAPQNLSIVGSENVFDLQLINATARDLIAERLFQFVLSYLLTKKSSTPSGGGDQQTELFDVKMLSPRPHETTA